MKPVFIRELTWWEPEYANQPFQEMYERKDLHGIFRTVITLLNVVDRLSFIMTPGESTIFKEQLSVMRRDVNRNLAARRDADAKLSYLLGVGDIVQRMHNNILRDLLASRNIADSNAAEMIAQELYDKECRKLMQQDSAALKGPDETEHLADDTTMNDVTGVNFECCPITKVRNTYSFEPNEPRDSLSTCRRRCAS